MLQIHIAFLDSLAGQLRDRFAEDDLSIVRLCSLFDLNEMHESEEADTERETKLKVPHTDLELRNSN